MAKVKKQHTTPHNFLHDFVVQDPKAVAKLAKHFNNQEAFVRDPETAAKLAERFNREEAGRVLADKVAGAIFDSPGHRAPPTRKSRSKRKAQNLGGRPPEYDQEAIEALTREVLSRGTPDLQSLVIEKVRDLASDRHVKLPGETRLKEIIAPIYRATKP